jgi:RND family efflux transporter MFP subunit
MNRLAMVVCVAVMQSVAIGQGPPPARVRLDEVREQVVERQRQVTGQLRASRGAQAASREEGRVEAVLVDVGDAVAAGQPMVRLDGTLMRLELAKIDADIEALERTVDEAAALSTQAELQVTRRERAVREGGVSATELEDARTALAAAAARAARAEADVTAARSTRDRIRQRIEDLEVRAPFAGSVVAKLVEVGEWIDTGDAVVELVELDPIDAWLEVPERYIDDVESASSIEVVVESLGVSVVGAEVAIVAQANELSRTFPVRVRVPNVSGALKPGMSVSAMIPTGLRENAVTVRKDALLRDDAGTFVYFDAGGMAMAARVERLWGVGDRVVIRSDALRPGMKVVIEGNERMYPTQPIVDIDAPPAAPGGGGGTVDAKGGR